MKLKKLLSIFQCFRKSRSVKKIPDEFNSFEKISRSIFSPINLNKAETKLLANAFRSPPAIDEVSVIRLSHTDENFCKKHGKAIENPSSKRSFYGLALLYVSQILSTKSTIVYTPNSDNLYHSDIKIGFVPERGKQLPAEFQKKVKDMADQSRLFKDSTPASENWGGGLVE